jgi:hypothetical protein
MIEYRGDIVLKDEDEEGKRSEGKRRVRRFKR